MTDQDIKQLLALIAKDELRVATLETRHSDSLDFYDCGVASIHSALRAAFDLGRALAQVHAPERKVKLKTMARLMQRDQGATTAELCAATGWQQSTVLREIGWICRWYGLTPMPADVRDGQRVFCVR